MDSFEFGGLARLSTGLGLTVFLLLLVVAWAKAAQFPFHTWLPDSMAAPTPVNVFLDAVALVNASILLLARVLASSWAVPNSAAVVMAAMAMVSIFMAIMNYFRQDDLKRLLAYSTIAHLGYMFIGLALGAWGSTIGFRGGLLHILCHGVAKCTLFLAVGAIAYGRRGRIASANCAAWRGRCLWRPWPFQLRLSVTRPHDSDTMGYLLLEGQRPRAIRTASQ